MDNIPNPISLVGLIVAVGLLPFLVVMSTAFIKLVVVFSLLRNAMGIQQIPPNIVLHGLALVLTIYIMAPVGIEVIQGLENIDLGTGQFGDVVGEVQMAAEPFREFLSQHGSDEAKTFFTETARSLWPAEIRDQATPDNYFILIPAFTLSELKEAFEIGFLIYLPFIAIDLIVSNILLAMGMMMVSPMTISLPFKLLLFVLLDGWTQLINGLVLSYA